MRRTGAPVRPGPPAIAIACCCLAAASALPIRAAEHPTAPTVRAATLQLRQATGDGRYTISASLAPRSGHSSATADGTFRIESAAISGGAGCPLPSGPIFRDGFEAT
jgi:hypothetical protein